MAKTRELERIGKYGLCKWVGYQIWKHLQTATITAAEALGMQSETLDEVWPDKSRE
jgi:hypothetical protein